jgi:hypothetical protein
MKNLFVSYEHAIGLKELGFNEPCFGFYTHNGEIRRYTNVDGELNDFQTLKNSRITMGDGWCTVPTYQQAFRWFREKYNLLGIVGYCDDNSGKFMSVIDKINSDIDYDMNAKDTYEEAEDACLDRLIKITKDKK